MESGASLCDLLERWRSGDQAAAAAIYARYEQRLVRLAERKIGPHLQVAVSPDDIALSVLDSVLGRIARGCCSVDPSGSIWHYVAKIARSKISKRAEHYTAAKRDARKTVDTDVADISSVPSSRTPTPEEAAVLADELEKIRSRLKPADFEIFQFANGPANDAVV
jgi:hypothetical protein